MERRPERIRLSRQRGWRKPEGAIVVARPTEWGNPFVVGPDLTRAQAVDLYRDALLEGYLAITVEDVRRDLAGHDLACWCPLSEPCHSDVLLEVANGD